MLGFLDQCGLQFTYTWIYFGLQGIWPTLKMQQSILGSLMKAEGTLLYGFSPSSSCLWCWWFPSCLSWGPILLPAFWGTLRPSSTWAQGSMRGMMSMFLLVSCSLQSIVPRSHDTLWEKDPRDQRRVCLAVPSSNELLLAHYQTIWKPGYKEDCFGIVCVYKPPFHHKWAD